MKNETDILLHRAVQYLASFGINYLQKESDDSHTNLGWDEELKAFKSRPLDDGMHLRLYVEDLRLEWVSKQSYPLELIGHSHGEVCIWLHHIALRCGLIEYDFYLHYSLDSGKILPDMVYEEYDRSRALELIALRDLAQRACEEAVSQFSLKTDVRVWPHHFDTGGYATLPDSDIAIGLGMAVPDSMLPEHYLYVSGYKVGKAIDVKGRPALSQGKWMNDSFKGAVLPIGTPDATAGQEFFQEAISSYK